MPAVGRSAVVTKGDELGLCLHLSNVPATEEARRCVCPGLALRKAKHQPTAPKIAPEIQWDALIPILTSALLLVAP